MPLNSQKPNPYEKCPTYEGRCFQLRLVTPEDAVGLLDCYKNPTPSVAANGDRCCYGYGAQTLAEMRQFIEQWLQEYKNGAFVRFCVVYRQENKPVGTVEMYGGGPQGYGILRIDLSREFENEAYLEELLELADNFFSDFGCEAILTKSVQRTEVLARHGYTPSLAGEQFQYKGCYLKQKP